MVAENHKQNIPSQPRSKGPRRWLTGYAMLGSAIAWAVHLSVMYFLVQPVCRLGGEAWFHVVTGVALFTCVAAGIAAWRHRPAEATFEHLFNGEGGWQSFVALFGVVASAIFAYAIVYQWLPVLTTATCEGIRPLP